MPYVITLKCLEEVYAQCVDACPVDCIHPGPYQGKAFMVIDPNDCIECDACLPACPIGAIVPNTDDDPEATKINAELASTFKGNPPAPQRAKNDPPKRADNKLVNV